MFTRILKNELRIKLINIVSSYREIKKFNIIIILNNISPSYYKMIMSSCNRPPKTEAMEKDMASDTSILFYYMIVF